MSVTRRISLATPMYVLLSLKEPQKHISYLVVVRWTMWTMWTCQMPEINTDLKRPSMTRVKPTALTTVVF